MPIPATPDRFWRRLFLGLLAVGALLTLLVFRDFGVTWDEEGQNAYGRMVARWYLSLFQDRSALTFSNLYLYGGLYELMVQPWLSLARLLRADEWEVRHLVNMGAALVGVGFTYRLGSFFGSARTGFFAALFLLLTPVYVGHAANNPKDLPFAVFVVIAVDALLRFGRALPRPSPRTLVWTGVALGLPLGVRIGGFFLVGYLGMVWLAALAVKWRTERVRPGPTAVLALGAVLLVAWGVMLSGWPWGQTRPFANPILGVLENVRFKWAGTNLYDGAFVEASKLPWTYLPRWFGMVLPEYHFAALAGGLVACLAWWRRASLHRAVELGLLGFFAAFPLVSAILLRSTLYDGMRHFLFVVPLLAALVAVAVEGLATAPGLRNWVKALFLAPVAASALLTLTDLVRLHPYQAYYFNRSVAGGGKAASQRFPVDYWRSSHREAILWIAQRYRPEEPKIRVAGCSPPFILRATADRPAARGRIELVDWQDAELVVSSTADGCGHAGERVHLIERMGMPIGYVFRVKR